MRNNKLIKAIVAGLAATIMVGTIAGCGGTQQQVSSKASSEAQKLSGKLTLAGSTSMQKLCEAMKESFMEKYPDVTVTVEYTGSGAGMESLAKGSVDIGNASRALKDGEKANGSVENIVAIDGIAVITDTKNKVKDLTKDQLTDIYTGKTTNWKQLGGDDAALVVIGREAGSGTRGAFEELLKIEDKCKYAQELDTTGGVLAKVAATPGAIGYVSLDVVDKTVSALSLNKVEPTEKNILAGDYILSRPFVMATKGEVDKQNDVVKEWFKYVKSDEGQKVIKGLGLILPK